MRYFTILIFTTLWVLNSYAQEFGTHWVSYPFPNDSSEILYRKIYHLDQKPLKAEINMASGEIPAYTSTKEMLRQAFSTKEPETASF